MFHILTLKQDHPLETCTLLSHLHTGLAEGSYLHRSLTVIMSATMSATIYSPSGWHCVMNAHGAVTKGQISAECTSTTVSLCYVALHQRENTHTLVLSLCGFAVDHGTLVLPYLEVLQDSNQFIHSSCESAGGAHTPYGNVMCYHS